MTGASGEPAAKETLYEGRFVRFVRRDGWEYVERVAISGIVLVLAVTDDDELVLVEQHRPPLGRRIIELPAGLAGDSPETSDEDLALAARRELLEETGFEAARFERLTEGPPSAGLSAESLTLFRAHGLRRTGAGGGDASEDIVVHVVPLDNVEAWLADRGRAGLAIDMKIWAGLYFLRR